MRSILLILLALAAGSAGAQPVRCVDAQGRTRYVDASQAGSMKCRPVSGEASVVSPQGAGSSPAAESGGSPGSNPQREAAARQRNAAADADRAARQAAAEARVEKARKDLEEQENQRLGGEKNFARYEERLAPYREAVRKAELELQQILKPAE